MAKKTSRKKRKQRKTNVPQYAPPTEPQEATEAAPVVAQPVIAATTAKKSSIAGIDAIGWTSEYPFVIGDLRGMAVVAALMVALLLGLNFFLN